MNELMIACGERSVSVPAEGVCNFPSPVEVFTNLVINYRETSSPAAYHDVEDAVRAQYGYDAALAILCLLSDAEEAAIRRFASMHMFPKEFPQQTGVEILVRPTAPPASIKGNTGFYSVYTRKGTEVNSTPLHFKNQASMVYYLMFLIHKKQMPLATTPVSLYKNRDVFKALYLKVYDVTAEKVEKRLQSLLFRVVDGGTMRAGRKNQLIKDIRDIMQDAFEAYNESFRPYAMTARTHLTVSADKIHFEGDAEKLLGFHFV